MRIAAAALFLASVPSPALAQSDAARSTPAAPPKDVVVTGRRLADTDAALQACLARHCPPAEDIDASLKHADNLFVAGRYKDARDTVMSSLGRNKRYAKDYPVPVSGLWRAASRLSVHLGEADVYRIASIESLDALKAGLPANDPRVVAQQLEVADTYAHLGRIEGAIQMYDAVGRRAEQLNQPQTAALVQLRKAVLYTALSERDADYRPMARREIARLASGSDPALAPYRQAAGILSAQLAIKAGDKDGVEKLVAAARVSPTDRPTLIYSPPIDDQSNARAFDSGDVMSKTAVGDFEDQWADVSFWVKPDGTVIDADILRGSATLDRRWLQPVLKAVGNRRYAPLKLASTDPGVLRVERYTRTAHLVTLVGSRIRQREAYPRIEMLDLTEQPGSSAPAG